MGRIHEASLKGLVDSLSPVVKAALAALGGQVWPPYQQKRGLLRKPALVPRFMLEGPVQRGDEVLWAVSHTRKPSTFDAHGDLLQGEREYWIVALKAGEPPHFRIEGAGRLDGIAADAASLTEALQKARVEGPKYNTFYGNKGPLSQR